MYTRTVILECCTRYVVIRSEEVCQGRAEISHGCCDDWCVEQTLSQRVSRGARRLWARIWLRVTISETFAASKQPDNNWCSYELNIEGLITGVWHYCRKCDDVRTRLQSLCVSIAYVLSLLSELWPKARMEPIAVCTRFSIALVVNETAVQVPISSKTRRESKVFIT